MEEPKKKIDPYDIPRTFLTPAYVIESEPGTFAMFRDITVETDEVGPDGKKIREKLGKRLGPLFLFRECRKDEQADFVSSRPDGSVLLLFQIHPPKEAP